MTIWNRVSSLVRATRNGRREPGVSLDSVLRDYDLAIREARDGLAAAITWEKLLQAEARQAQDQADHWLEDAEIAVAAGDDFRARECLRQHRAKTAEARRLSEQRMTFSSATAKFRLELGALQHNRAELANTRDVLSARLKVAQSLAEQAKQRSALALSDAPSHLRQLERDARAEELRAFAYIEAVPTLAPIGATGTDEATDLEGSARTEASADSFHLGDFPVAEFTRAQS